MTSIACLKQEVLHDVASRPGLVDIPGRAQFWA
jgi:hypothetical protein